MNAYLVLMKIGLIFLVVDHGLCSICQEMLDVYSKLQNPYDISNPLNSGGKELNDLGTYTTCLYGKDSNDHNNFGKFDYFVIRAESINNLHYPESYIGFCLPIECMNEDGYDYAIKFVGTITYGIYNTGEIIRSTLENKKYSRLSSWNIVVLALLCCVILSCTMISWYISRSQMQINEVEKLNLNLHNQDDSVSTLLLYPASSTDFLPNIYRRFDYFRNLKELTSFTYCSETQVQEEVTAQIQGIQGLTIFIIIGSMTLKNNNLFPIRNEEVGSISKWFLIQSDTILYNTLFIANGFFLGKKLNTIISEKKQLTTFLYEVLFLLVVYFLVFFVYSQILPCIVDGPLSGSILNKEINECSNSLKSKLLLFSSFIADKPDSCFDWGWLIQTNLLHLVIGVIFKFLHIHFKYENTIIVKVCYVLMILGAGFKALFLGLNNILIDVADLTTLFESSHFSKVYLTNPLCKLECYWFGILIGVISITVPKGNDQLDLITRRNAKINLL